MKLGIVTLWTNGREEAPLRRRVPAVSTSAPIAPPAVETGDVLSAKPLFAVDDFTVAFEEFLAVRSPSRIPPAPRSASKAKAPRKRSRAANKGASRSRARGAV